MLLHILLRPVRPLHQRSRNDPDLTPGAQTIPSGWLDDSSGVPDDGDMTDDRALQILGDYLDDEGFADYPDLVPLSPHLLWGLFCS